MSNQTNRNPPNKQPSINPNLPLNFHFKLFAFDLNSLTPSHSLSSSSSSSRDPNFFLRKGVPVSRVEVFGVVVTRDFKPDKFLRFSIDDGTGCIQCILWLNQLTSSYYSRRRTSDVQVIAEMANIHSSRVELGFNVRVRGKLSGFRGSIQVTVDDVVVERDPNYQILHMLDCINLARKRYDGLSCKK